MGPIIIQVTGPFLNGETAKLVGESHTAEVTTHVLTLHDVMCLQCFAMAQVCSLFGGPSPGHTISFQPRVDGLAQIVNIRSGSGDHERKGYTIISKQG